MNVTLRQQRWTLGVVAICGLLAAPVLAQSRVVAVETASDSVRFNPSERGPWLLRLSLPSGRVIEREARPGEELLLDGKALPGEGWADGEYVWELVAVGSADAGAVQTGGFRVIDGQFFVPAGRVDQDVRATRSATGREDQVVPDDLIVDGKACVGLACATNEPFGQETLRLKQAVVRIKLEDNSGGVGFPTRDWQITANDAASGGFDRFSIEDLGAATTPFTIFGGTPANRFVAAPSGNVGIGTSVPATLLHVFGTSAAVDGVKLLVDASAAPAGPREMFEVRNNGIAVFIFEDTTVPERWGFGTIGGSFAIDNQASGGIEYGFGPTGVFTALNSVGVGTAAPAGRLHVTTSAATTDMAIVENTNASNSPRSMLKLDNLGAPLLIYRDRGATVWSSGPVGGSFILDDQADGQLEFNLAQNGNLVISGTLTQGSSQAIKNGFEGIDAAAVLERVATLPITTWSYNDEPGVRHMGPMAEDFYAAFSLGGTDKGITTADSAGVAFAAIQGLYEDVRQRNAELEARIARLEALVRSLTPDHTP